jgi:uncharacterized protein (TIGR03435 family)
MKILDQAMRAVKPAVALLGIAAISALAQSPAFEVASVKVSPPRAGTAGFTGIDSDPAMVRYSNITLKNLIAIAYGFDSRLILAGPAWLDSEHYDVAAKLPPDTSKDRVPMMLQTLLVERFKLAVHRETKEQRLYSLVVGKKGPKLKEGREAGGQNQIVRGGIMGHSMPMGVLAGLLSGFLGYEIVDKTGLTGTFDINLKWRPEDGAGNSPDLFAAIQEQLGLKLEPGKGPVETLRIDHAERLLTDN